MPPDRVTIRNGDCLLDVPTEAAEDDAFSTGPDRRFLDQGPVGIAHLDREGVITFENGRLRDLVGNDEPSWIGRSVADVQSLPPGLAGQVSRMLREDAGVVATRGVLSQVGRTARAVSIHGAPVRDDDGVVIGATLVVVDRSDDHEHHEELRIRRLYDHAAALLQNAALTLASEHAFLDEAVRLLGESAQADQVFILLSAEDADAYEEEVRWAREPERSLVPLRMDVTGTPLAESLATGVAHLRSSRPLAGSDSAIEYDLLDEIHASEALALPFMTAGDRRGVLLLARAHDSSSWSVIERRAIERIGALFETLLGWMRAEQRYRDAITAIEDALVVYAFDSHLDRTFSLLTRQIRHVAGYEAEVLLAGKVSWARDLVHPEDRQTLQAFERRLRSSEEAKLIYRVVDAGGNVRWLRESASARRDATGRVTVASILSDVTDQKDAEDALRRAKHEAEAAARMKSAFLATMSHELRTPLGAIKGFADLLCEEIGAAEGVPEEVTEFAEVIQTNATRILRLIGDLIDLACLQTDGLPIEQAPIALGPLLEDLARRYTPQLRERGLELVMQDRSAEFLARADQRRLEQVLDIILSNAAKFTEQGRIEVELSSGEDAIRITVSDTGIGIGEESLDRVFEPFYQEDNRLNRDFEGSGLGLSLAQRLVEAMGGEIGILRREGGGTAVTVRLPRADG